MFGKRIAIIGCGYVGSAVGEALMSAGHTVVGTTTSREGAAHLRSLGISHRQLLASDRAGLRELIVDRDAVYLTIAAGRRGRSYREVYLAAATNLAACLPDSAVRRVIYTSSTSVYAQNDGNWVDEDSPAEPITENGRVLRAAEEALLDAPGHGAESASTFVSVVRLSGIHGPGRDGARIGRRAAGTERADGDTWLNLVHRDDIVEALVRLLATEHHGVLCLSDDCPVRRRDFYDKLLASSGLPPVRWRSEPDAGEGKRVRNARIKQLLELTLRHPTH